MSLGDTKKMNERSVRLNTNIKIHIGFKSEMT